MKITELECYKISNSFPLRSSDKCSIQNDFAVIIDTGVHILSFRPNLWNNTNNKCQKYAIQRAFIQTPSKYPLDDLPVDYQKLDREKFCLLYLNSKLRPNDERLEAPIRRVKQVDWGSLSSSFHHKSVLGVLTNQGCLQLYSCSRFKWVEFANISELWKNHCIKTWFSKGEDDFESFMKAYKCIRIVAFAWCNGVQLNNENDALLMCVSESGMLSFWMLSADITNVPPTLVNTHQLGSNVHSYLWHTASKDEGCIIGSFIDGTVSLYACDIDHESNEINVHCEIPLWTERDYCVAENLKMKVNSRKSILVLSKEHWLLIFHLDDDVTVQKFKFDKRIAGLEILNDFRVFVTLLNFKSFIVKPDDVKYRLPVSCNLPTNVKNHRCSGVSFSKNKEFCVFSVNLAKFHDHLTFKEPWYLLWCSVNNKISLVDLLRTVIESSVRDAFDCIENFRIQTMERQTVIDKSMLELALNYLDDDDPEKWRKVLQLMYILMSGCKLSKSEEDVFVVETLLSICNFQYLCTKEKEVHEIQFYYSWLKANYSKLPEEVKAKYKLLENIPKEMEENQIESCDVKCELCSSDFNVHHYTNYIICEKEHKVLRCRYTFLPILSQPYSECSCCHAVVIRIAGLRRCVICDSEL